MGKTLAGLAMLFWGMGLVSSVVATENNSNPATVITQPVDYVLTGCQEMPGKSDPASAERFVDPAWLVAGYYYKHFKHEPDPTSVLVTLLENPKHGKISERKDTSHPMYQYDAEPEYEGKDQVTFLATYHGNTYKVVVNLLVSPVESIPDNGPGMCPAPKLVKSNGRQK